MKRVELQAAPLVITLERVPAEETWQDYIDLTVTRGEDLRVLSAEIDRGNLLGNGDRYNAELTNSELVQIDSALCAEWLAWPPTITADDMPRETILDVFAKLKASLRAAGAIKGEGAGAE